MRVIHEFALESHWDLSRAPVSLVARAARRASPVCPWCGLAGFTVLGCRWVGLTVYFIGKPCSTAAHISRRNLVPPYFEIGYRYSSIELSARIVLVRQGIHHDQRQRVRLAMLHSSIAPQPRPF